MLEKELAQKSQMFEENLQRMREQQQVLEMESEMFAALIEVNTAGFEKMKNLTQERLDRKTAEITRTDDQIETFIEDFENFGKALERKEV